MCIKWNVVCTNWNYTLPLQEEIANMLIECCSQERSYLRFYGLLGQVKTEIDNVRAVWMAV